MSTTESPEPQRSTRSNPLVGPVDVITRRRGLYLTVAYSALCEIIPEMEDSGEGYNTYLLELAEGVEADLENFSEVFLAPVVVGSYLTWAAEQDLDAARSSTRRRYISEMESDDLYSVTSVEELLGMVQVDALATLTRMSDIDMSGEDGLSEEEFDERMDIADDVFHRLVAFLHEVIDQHAVLTYSAIGLVDDKEIVQGGAFDVVRFGEGDVGPVEHIFEDLFDAVIRMGVTYRAGLTVRCFNVDPDTAAVTATLYGWSISRAGLRGMSEAELFDASCINSEGEPIPPEEGVTYAGTDENAFLIDGDDFLLP